MSTQNTIVERASAELTKRINGLRKHGNSNSTAITSNSSIVGKTSVMERVTNVLCGGSSSNVHNNNNINNNTNSTTAMSITTPEKPYRYQSKHNNIFAQHGKLSGSTVVVATANSNSNSNQSTPQSLRKYHAKPPTATKRFVPLAPQILSIEQLFLDERFLQHFFLFFSSYERRELAQVCSKWRDILYRNPIFFSGLVPVLQCRELRMTGSQDKVKLYNSIIRRGFHSIALSGATDEDALDIVHSFALASKHIHSLSLRCSSISDRGLEALLDHLQVSVSCSHLKRNSSLLVVREKLRHRQSCLCIAWVWSLR